MDATVAATITGVLLSVSFAAYAMSFARLRSDMHAGFDRLETHFDRLDTHFDRMDTRFDELTTALGCSAAPTESDDSEGDH